jgi:glycerol dehydrogenase-like iron-containing ADH family enzyme
MLEQMGCPVRFSELGVPRETMEGAIESAYTVRNRYTILTLAHELGLTEQLKPILMEKYY